jgi:two-component system, NarL family, sensor kinase
MQINTDSIKILLLIVIFMLMLMTFFIFLIIYLHRKKQIQYQENLNKIETNYEQKHLKTQLEIQEQTFQNISREIHDNITLSLTLAKLNLHTLDRHNPEASDHKIRNSIELLTKTIGELSDISKGLNADIIIQHGLLKALEEEMQRIRQTGMFSLSYEVEGTPVYLQNQQELIIFRIIQESFNNIIKHAGASDASLLLRYSPADPAITITDNGRGPYTRCDNTGPEHARYGRL